MGEAGVPAPDEQTAMSAFNMSSNGLLYSLQVPDPLRIEVSHAVVFRSGEERCNSTLSVTEMIK
jgi:hypothetical protein